MTAFFKAESRGLTKATDRSRLRDKAGALVHYIWRARLKDLATAQMMTSVDSYHSDLLRYVRRDDHSEEVAAKLARNILCHSPEAIAEEVSALLEAADGGDGLVEHFIVSIRQDEEMLKHFEEAVDILLQGLGLENCPAVAAVHLDTDNPHFHLMVTRVDIHTGEPVPLPEYDLLRAHQLLACMEDRFGWRREAEARWEVRDGRLIGDGGSIDLGPADDPSVWPDENFSRAKCVEAKSELGRNGSGLSSEQLVRKVIPDLVERHHDLGSFLSDLRRYGIELAMTGSNAAYQVHYVDDEGRKASENVRPSVLRKWSTAKLQERFGPLPRAFSGKAKPRKATRHQVDRIRFEAEKAEFQVRLKRVSSALRKSHGKAVSEAMPSARSSCTFPSFEDWMAGARSGDPAEILAMATGSTIVHSPKIIQDPPRLDIIEDASFRGRMLGAKVVYTAKDRSEASTRITDCGDVIVITGRPTDAAIALSLRLLKLRGEEAVIAEGFSKRDLKRVHKIASEMGMAVVQPQKHRLPRFGDLIPQRVPRKELSETPLASPFSRSEETDRPAPQPATSSSQTPRDAEAAKPVKKRHWPSPPSYDLGR